ncbi:MAG: DUF4287 domain-containing protein [Chitinophagaceae bacterium]|nr:MAG: DUF4287 domain-containing protein [Chitinophagaceae bacterium]
MDKGEITMIENLRKNTGKSLEQWIAIVSHANLDKHGQIVKYLKENHEFTHGFANLVALKAKASGVKPGEDEVDLVQKQYEGKEHFRALYERLIAEVNKFGKDIEVAPKKAYVSLRRSKQFALLQPASKTRYEIGLILKNQPASGKLQAITTPNAMCTHKILLTSEKDLDNETIKWLKTAYEKAE